MHEDKKDEQQQLDGKIRERFERQFPGLIAELFGEWEPEESDD